MRSMKTAFFLALAFGLSSAPSLYAHHGNAAYDMKNKVTLTGTVSELSLANPHSTVAFDVKDKDGNVSHWVVEFGVLRDLTADGWTNDTLKSGDQIKLTVHPRRDGDPGGMLAGGITYANGREIPLSPPKGQQTFHRPIRW
jgi:hypothetical protein